jgi:prevent-host-death family protein
MTVNAVTVGVAEAHDRLSELIDQAVSGVDVVIAKRSRPVVRLVPVEPVAPQGNGKLAAATAAELMRRHAARRSVQEIEQYVREERASWR